MAHFSLSQAAAEYVSATSRIAFSTIDVALGEALKWVEGNQGLVAIVGAITLMIVLMTKPGKA